MTAKPPTILTAVKVKAIPASNWIKEEKKIEEEEEKDQYPRVLLLGSQLQLVSISSSHPGTLDQRLRRELVELLED